VRSGCHTHLQLRQCLVGKGQLELEVADQRLDHPQAIGPAEPGHADRVVVQAVLDAQLPQLDGIWSERRVLDAANEQAGGHLAARSGLGDGIVYSPSGALSMLRARRARPKEKGSSIFTRKVVSF
jgi:hypothetical protein